MFQLLLEPKIAQSLPGDFSLYEIFLEMEKEALVSKFYIIEPSQNWDKSLNKPVSQFDIEAEID